MKQLHPISSGLSQADFWWQLPILILVFGSLVLVLATAFQKNTVKDGGPIAPFSFAALCSIVCFMAAGAALLLLCQVKTEGEQAFMHGLLVADRIGYVLVAMVCVFAGLTCLSVPSHQQQHSWVASEWYALVLFAVTGMAILVMAGDLITVFLGLEGMSLALYAMIALRRRSKRSIEAAMKYFLLGAFSTGFLLYGLALVYGAFGETQIAAIRGLVATATVSQMKLLVLGMLLCVVAFGFKVAAAPFHMWTPDAYEGAPTPTTGLMAGVVKIAAIGGMLRVFWDIFGDEVMPFGTMGWGNAIVLLAALSMTIGNLAALRQSNIKRMLAYSSIAHAGVLLIAVAAGGLGALPEARAAILYYLLVYGATTIGAFAIVSWIGKKGHERLLLSDWNGLAASHPIVSLAMAVCMLSFAGIPPTGGFLAKFFVFESAMHTVDNQLQWLVIVGVINSVVGAYYYLRVVMAMYFKMPVDIVEHKVAGSLWFVVIVCLLIVAIAGVAPQMFLSCLVG